MKRLKEQRVDLAGTKDQVTKKPKPNQLKSLASLKIRSMFKMMKKAPKKGSVEVLFAPNPSTAGKNCKSKLSKLSSS